ncbi:unnamed protein product [Peniophora sp. CBMAI 1063]|nr:unnamed protein product [Peniophora sp. CBMAI 1063]
MTLSLAEREWIVYAARHNAIVKTLGTAIDPLIEGPIVCSSAVQEGLMFEEREALANAISGINAIRRVPLKKPWKSFCQAGALSNPSGSYRLVCGAEEFTWREDLDPINSTITAVMDCAMQMAGVTGRDPTSAIPLGFWWEDPDDAETKKLLSRKEPGVARAALAASMYLSSEVGIFIRC